MERYIGIIGLISFEGAGLESMILGALAIAGMWLVFKKCGIPGWHALIPCYRYYELGRCALRELDGRVMLVLQGPEILLSVLMQFPMSDMLGKLLSLIDLVLVLVMILYRSRIYLGLFQNFGMKKGWVFVLIQCLPLLYAGLRKQPAWNAAEAEIARKTYFDSADTAVMDEGLTVNLKSRTVRELLKKKYLLRDIHMYMKPGHMILLLGGSGAGKTTLLNAINGYEKADAKVNLNGSDVYADYKKMMYEVGFVPQQDLVRYQDTVLNTLTDAAALRLPQDFTRAERRERVDEVMKIFGLLPVQNSQVSKLSGGQKKRLSIAMEFISNPSLFILDEPDSGLDGVMARELMQQLRTIADQGKIVIVITHTPDRVIDLFDDVIVLAKDKDRTGRLAWFGPIEEARSFFDKPDMEQIVRTINRREEGGEGRADEFIAKYAEVQHG